MSKRGLERRFDMVLATLSHTRRDGIRPGVWVQAI